jgi:hypothetical protein
MPPLKQFAAPAFQDVKDFAGHTHLTQFQSLWNDNVNGWTRQAIAGGGDFYYNPLVEPNVPSSADAKQVPWFAFPNRVDFYLGNAGFSNAQIQEFADNGFLADGTPIPAIPGARQVCSGDSTPTIAFGPYGPRGWQDEYCEWSVTRNSAGKIVRVDFACENPEYWYSLWRIDPALVAELYSKTLSGPYRTVTVKPEDLELTYLGQKVIDPFTNKAAYNPLNKWNTGTVSNAKGGGVMHLTSTPNTLQTELGLAGAATLRYPAGSRVDAGTLLCCGNYGQPQRNSDPTIGFGANQVVEANNKISLANPPGLYLQMPSFTGWVTPDATPAGNFWTVVRGAQTLPGFDAKFNFILHAVFEVPPNKGYTVSDITINSAKIQWASQIARTFQVALYPLPIPQTNNQSVTQCFVPNAPCGSAQPLQVMHQSLFLAYYGTFVANARNFPMSLASNSIIVAPDVQHGKDATLAVICSCAALGPNGELPAVTFTAPGSSTPDPKITATVQSLSSVFYAIPGNSYPSESQLLVVKVSVARDAALGVRDISVANRGGTPGSLPYSLTVY